MARIDIAQIEGYEEMSLEEKVATLEGLELPEPETADEQEKRYNKLKENFDKVSSELAKKQKEERERMTAEERAEEERKAQWEAMQTELSELRRERAIDKATAKYLEVGFDAELAKATPVAYVEGDHEAVFDNQMKFQLAREKAIRAELLKQTPVPHPGEDGGVDAGKGSAAGSSEWGVTTPKTEDSVRELYVPASVIEYVKKMEQERQVYHLSHAKNDGFVCCGQNGSFKNPEMVYLHFKRLLRSQGLPEAMRFHDLRHSYASNMIEAGLPLKTVSHILGHSSIGITADIYCDVINKHKEAAEVVENSYMSVLGTI